MDEKRQAVLHELLQQHQEPFHLKTYISDKRSQAQPRTRAFLHVPPGTAALLIQAATRIQHHHRKSHIRTFFASFFKHRRQNSEPTSFSASPSRCVKQEGEIVEEKKEQCSPVSVLEALCEDEDEDEHQSLVGEEDDSDYDYDVERSYANIQRARQHLLERLERFEKLAALDDVDLEQKLLQDCEEECEVEFGVCRKVGLESRSLILKESRMKKKNKCKIVVGKSCCPDSIDDVIMEMDLQFKTEVEVEETATQLELQIFQELIEQCFCIV